MSRAPLKVLQICHDYEGPFKGVAYEFNSAFADHHVTTLFLRGADTPSVREAVGGDEVIFFEQAEGSLSGIKWTTIFRVAALFRRQKFDLVIAHRYKGIYLAGIMSYFFTIPLILGVAHEMNVFRRPTRALFLTFWRPRIVMLAISGAVADSIERYCPGLVSAGRLFVTGHGIDDSAAQLPRTEARQLLDLPQDALVFGTVGRLVRKKEQHLLIEGFAIADLNATLCLVGDGPLAAALAEQAQGLGCGQRVCFAGWQTDAARLLSAFDAFVFPSGDEEGFGIVLLEAMRAGVPVISSNAPGPAEVLGATTPGPLAAGLLFQAGDAGALAEQLRHFNSMSEEARQQMADQARQHFRQEFTLAAFRHKLLTLPPVVALLK